MAFQNVNGPEIIIEDVEASRANGNTYNPRDDLRDNLLQITNISTTYNEQQNQVMGGQLPDRSLNWILDRTFYRGAASVASQILNSSSQLRTAFVPEIATGLFVPGAAEFLQFLEVTIQRWLYQTSRQLLDQQLIDSASFRYCQQLLCQPRENVNQTIRQLFYHFYNGTGHLRNLNQTRWDGDIKKIMDTIISLIRRTFSAEEERSDFLDLIPHLQFVQAPGVANHRWTWELEERPQYLTLLFSLIMIRLPTKNLSNPNSMVPLTFDFPIITEDQMLAERLRIEISDANMNHLFYFVPEHNRVFGVWPQNIKVKNDANSPSQRMVLNYKANLIRSIVVKIKIPSNIADLGGQIAFDYLFFNPTRNLYKMLRERNPFHFSDEIDPLTRLYVGLTIYANQNETVLHIPYVLEGSLTNGTPHDVEEFCNEYDRVLQLTASGASLNLRTAGVDEFYFYFSLIHDPSLNISRVPISVGDEVAHQRPRLARVTSNRQNSTRPNVDGMLVGAPYVGTKKEKHYLLGSLINRFTNSAALFRTPIKRMNSCLMMSLIKAQMYQYLFRGQECMNVLVTGTNCQSVKSDCMFVECVTCFDNMPRPMPFLEKIGGKWFVKLFNSSKWKTDGDLFVAGAKDAIEEEYWEMASEEVWFQLQVHFQRSLDYTSLSEYGQAFSDFFLVCISIYDVEVRCNRVHVITPFNKTPRELVRDYGNILMVHLVFDQGHIHAVSSLPSFVKNEGRKDDLRLYNYCPHVLQPAISKLAMKTNFKSKWLLSMYTMWRTD